MKVFISWSGAVSHKVALALKEWLPKVVQAVKPFVSSEDIDKGAPWFNEIGSQLEETDFGILCTTPENLNAPWILFEAGALSKHVGQAQVSPLLIGVSNADLKGPLAQFNATSISREDVKKLLKAINKKLKKDPLSDEILGDVFDKWWPELETELDDSVRQLEAGQAAEPKPEREVGDILEELVGLTRSMAHQISMGGYAPIGGGLFTGVTSNVQPFFTRYPFASRVVDDSAGGVVYVADRDGDRLLRPQALRLQVDGAGRVEGYQERTVVC